MNKVTSSYRGLVRAAHLAFRGDPVALRNAHERIRSEYIQPVAPEEMLRKLQLARDVAHILRTNVVQGVTEKPEEPVYHLNIHKETELGDNDDRFGPTKSAPAGSTGCCKGSQ